MIPQRNKYLALFVASALTLGGCFTGVESTKRITDSDVRRQQAGHVTAEQRFMADIAPTPPAQWVPGRRMRVDDERVSLIFAPNSDASDGLVGHDLFFDGFAAAQSLTGAATDVVLRDDRGRHFYYRLNNSRAEVDTMEVLRIPFTVDVDVVQRVDEQMRGRDYYVRTPMWLNPATGERIDGGLRHIRVTVDSVGIGTANYPAAVYFHASEGPQGTYMLYMTVGSGRTATRNFDTLFAFDNPRKQYPEIRDNVWELIKRSRVAKDMTRDECRLALGAPQQIERIPTRAGMAERWRYSDGVYLVFDDGYLSAFRI